MSQWYQDQPYGPRRLELERQLMAKYTNFQLYIDDVTGDAIWKGSLTAHGYTHRNIQLWYASTHPAHKMTVFVLEPQLPQVNQHIHSDGTICYELNDWRPEWTALQVACLTQHFLNEFYSGSMARFNPRAVSLSPYESARRWLDLHL